MASCPGIMLAGQELEATADVLVGLLPGLTGAQARQALGGAVASNGSPPHHAARYWSLRRFLTTHPDALWSGRLVTAADRPRLVAPRDIKRLAVALHELGRQDVVIPVKRCGPRRHRVRDTWNARDGCVRCDTEDGLASCSGWLTSHLAGLSAEQAHGCLLEAIEGGRSRNAAFRLRVIGGWLGEHPDALASGDPDGPIDVLRLISALAEAGRADVRGPGCADCGRVRFLRAHRPDGNRICGSCADAPPAT